MILHGYTETLNGPFSKMYDEFLCLKYCILHMRQRTCILNKSYMSNYMSRVLNSTVVMANNELNLGSSTYVSNVVVSQIFSNQNG